jgi:hypothetical protein
MSETSPSPHAPPLQHTASGELRRVGVEIEFAGVQIAEAAEMVRQHYGGETRSMGAHRLHVDGTAWGRFVVELDTQYAHRPETKHGLADDLLSEATREFIGDAVTGIVPFEIICPPIPYDRLGDLNPLFDGLRKRGAQGTEEKAIYGFGLHLNVEVAEEQVDYLLRHVRAYLLLSDWLRQEIVIDLTRRILPHASRFPDEYALLVMAPDYSPGLREFIEDYAAYNPGRNRELDLYPLFRHLTPDLVDDLVDDTRIKARPAFHYRLPNASLSKAGWSAVTEWNRWIEVERLAADGERLRDMAQAFIAWHERPFHERWLDRLVRFLET